MLEFTDLTEDPTLLHTNSSTSPPNKCEATLTVTNIPNICKEQIIFEETFTKPSESKQFWTIEQRFADAPVRVFFL